jgi:hypothetical protein
MARVKSVCGHLTWIEPRSEPLLSDRGDDADHGAVARRQAVNCQRDRLAVCHRSESRPPEASVDTIGFRRRKRTKNTRGTFEIAGADEMKATKAFGGSRYRDASIDSDGKTIILVIVLKKYVSLGMKPSRAATTRYEGR